MYALSLQWQATSLGLSVPICIMMGLGETPCWPSSFCQNLFFFKFIYFEIELAQVGEGQREKERESQAGFVLPVQSLMRARIHKTLRSWPEPKARVGRLTD